MKIGEFSKRTGLSIDTLRYYEKEKLLTPQRDFNDRRVYCEADIRWVEFIIRLKETGMPLKEIRRYARLRAKGDCTMNERLEMLIAHKANLEAQIEKLNEHNKRLDDKIKYYRDEISKSS
ncbi:MAG: MerR family transcriptional regulator [Mucispirillum sp.]|nr:MerR family transcriptional regulator [Mucispirillum sp.]